MSKPTILAVDDDPDVSAAIARDLRGRYATDYRIVRATSGPEALEVLARLALRGQPVALIVADQRMPQMTGIEMLEQAGTHAPGAKYLLLTAYADTDVAIKAINDIGLDYYLLKPWDPPDERLFPVIDGLLGDWRQANPDHTSDVRVVGYRWSDRSHDIKMFLAGNYVPYRWYDVDRDAEAQRLRDLARATPPISRSCSSPTVMCFARRRHSSLRARSGCAPPPGSACMTYASWAAARPVWPPRCTRRRRALAPSSWSVRRPGARQVRARRSRTTWGSRRG